MSRPRYLLLVALFCLTWSSAFPAAKLAITTAPPSLFLGIRFTAAGVLLVAAAAAIGRVKRGTPWVTLLLLGVVNQAGYQGLAWQGMGTASAGIATIVTSLNPILIAALAAPVLGERLTWRKMLGLLVGLAGAVFIVRNRIVVGEDPEGIGFLVAALVSMVASTLAFKRLAPDTPLVLGVGIQQLGAGLVLLAAGLAVEDPAAIVPDARFWLTMAWFVLVVSVGAMLMWFMLLRTGSASSASALHFLMPPIGLAMSWAALGEPVSPIDLAGVVPVALGIWLATRSEAPRPEATR